MRKIALFGGSFDPVQNGHVEFIRLLAARFDKTIVVPCRISPFKTEADIASAPDRKAMLALALGRLRDVEISDYELRAAGVNLHSLAIIESAEPGNIVFREEA